MDSVLRPSHTKTEITKKVAHYNFFFTTATIFSTVLYMGNNFHQIFLRKIVVKIFVVCEGLYFYNCVIL